ncbi:MAG: hypothetical protein M1118_12365 [Chloroflexi bacterium]|nr:hypothetical protein [Chloroflexota bacterium]
MVKRCWRPLLAALFLAALLPVAPAFAQVNPSLMLTPSSGPVGTDVQIQGQGFPPLVAVYLRLGQVAGGDLDCRDARVTAPAPTAFTDEAGAFEETFMLPQQLGGANNLHDTAPGQYCVLGTSAPGLNVQALFTVTPAPKGATATCGFILGFATLRAAIPGQVGTCLENERHNPANGDGLQQTTKGLLVWRKADNHTAFTDGYHTWVNGPDGVQERLNTQHFPWEGPGSGAGAQLVAPAALGQIVSYYAELDRGDYADAYNLWHAPNQSYRQFVAGYTDTVQAAIRLGAPVPDNAMGNFGIDVPTVILARHSDGSTAAFAGCYFLLAPKPQAALAGPPVQLYKIVAAHIVARPDIHGFDGAAAQTALLSGCQ